jgi:cytochrome bd-type quinol oxidase subunit 2
MNLTEREQQMVARIRKHEIQWRWARWWALFAGLFCIAACVFFLCAAVPRVQGADAASGALILAILFPMILVFVGCATTCFVLVFRDWHGNPTRSLLLKLIDASTDPQTTEHPAA